MAENKPFLCKLGIHKWICQIHHGKLSIIHSPTFCKNCGLEIKPYGFGWMIGNKYTENPPVGKLEITNESALQQIKG